MAIGQTASQHYLEASGLSMVQRIDGCIAACGTPNGQPARHRKLLRHHPLQLGQLLRHGGDRVGRGGGAENVK